MLKYKIERERESQKPYMIQGLRGKKHRMHGDGVCIQDNAGLGGNEEKKSLQNLLHPGIRYLVKLHWTR